MSDLAILASRATGWAAALLLLGALAATPLARLFERVGGRAPARLAVARRAMGIASASFASAHGVLGLALYLESGDRWATITQVTWIRSGALALALLLPLLATSFPRLTVALRIRLWKPLHRLAYVAAVLVVHHVLLTPFAPRTWGISLAVSLVLAALGRAIPRAARAIPVEEPPPMTKS